MKRRPKSGGQSLMLPEGFSSSTFFKAKKVYVFREFGLGGYILILISVTLLK